MVKSAQVSSALLVLCAVGAAPCFAQSLVNPVVSDSGGNTAMGTGALVSDGTPNADTHVSVYNTAAGEAALNANTTGYGNSAFGNYALPLNTTGSTNTAVGAGALSDNVSGSANTATGYGALSSNTTGTNNTASGLQALATNSTGESNTAAGYQALYLNTTGSNNTASGEQSLLNNTTGAANTASGYASLLDNTTGYDNNAMGAFALNQNTSGYFNNAVGYYALYVNTVGYNNNAQGSYALSSNTTGYGNSGMGANALLNVTTGFRNVAVGNNTGGSLVAGSYDVDIGWGVTGSGDETGITRIGNPTYNTATYIAGIEGAHITGAAVYVTSSGQLGVLASSERYKTDITPMPADAVRLQQLRPVTFHLKSEPNGALQYGLIAEEVDKVYPELVIKDQAGQIQGVRYDELAPILLGELQQQRQELSDARALIATQGAKLAADEGRFALLEQRATARDSESAELKGQLAEIQELKAALRVELAKLQGKDSEVAMR